MKYVGNRKVPYFSDVTFDVVSSGDYNDQPRPNQLSLILFWSMSNVYATTQLRYIATIKDIFHKQVNLAAIHVAKFQAEKQVELICKYSDQNNYRLSIFSDSQYKLAALFDNKVIPTLFFLDPQRRVFYRLDGLVEKEKLINLVDKICNEYGKLGTDSTVEVQDLSYIGSKFPLSITYTGKNIIYNTSNDNHVYEINPKTRLVSHSEWYLPKDCETNYLFFYKDSLFFSELANHSVFVVSRSGTKLLLGSLGIALVKPKFNTAASAKLNSPAGMVCDEQFTYIAVEGFHQIWKIDRRSGMCWPYIGSSKRGLLDATLAKAQLSQPKGLTLCGTDLFFVDADSSSLRTCSTRNGARVVTLIRGNLNNSKFENNERQQDRLQFPTDLCYLNDNLYITDSYNHLIRKFSLTNFSMNTIAGNGSMGYKDGQGNQAQFSYPTGITTDGKKLFIADRYNSAIRVINLVNNEVSTLAKFDVC